MSRIRHEHRTVPVLIAVGVLLGAGLALASPAGHRSRGPSPTPGDPVSASPTADPSSTAPSPSSGSRDTGARDERACGPVEAVPGSTVGHGPLVHALHVMAATCSSGRGAAGLQNALARSNEHGSDGRSGHASDAADRGSRDGSGSSGHGNDAHGAGTGSPWSHPGHPGGSQAPSSHGSGGSSAGVDHAVGERPTHPMP